MAYKNNTVMQDLRAYVKEMLSRCSMLITVLLVGHSLNFSNEEICTRYSYSFNERLPLRTKKEQDIFCTPWAGVNITTSGERHLGNCVVSKEYK